MRVDSVAADVAVVVGAIEASEEVSVIEVGDNNCAEAETMDSFVVRMMHLILLS